MEKRNMHRWGVNVGDRVYKENLTRGQAVKVLGDLTNCVFGVKVVYNK